jgi:hypothetical protein
MTKSLMALVVVASSLFCACKTYLIDRESPNISDPQPDASVGLTTRCSERYRCGYVNREGRFVIAPVYRVVKPFYEGLAAVYKEGSGCHAGRRPCCESLLRSLSSAARIW